MLLINKMTQKLKFDTNQMCQNKTPQTRSGRGFAEIRHLTQKWAKVILLALKRRAR